MECYSAIKDEKLAIGIKWMKLEDTTLGKQVRGRKTNTPVDFGCFLTPSVPLRLCSLHRLVP